MTNTPLLDVTRCNPTRHDKPTRFDWNQSARQRMIKSMADCDDVKFHERMTALAGVAAAVLVITAYCIGVTLWHTY